MKYISITIKGNILASDVLEHLEDLKGQKSHDFGLPGNRSVREDIARVWGDAKVFWTVFERRISELARDDPKNNATTETRGLWIVPLLSLLGYTAEYQTRGEMLNGNSYPISHRATNRGGMPILILGCNDEAKLDSRPKSGSRRMSGHALMQEYLNLGDQLYGYVTNGSLLRVLRENSRLVSQSYVEFDIDRIFREDLFADFAALYRVLHATRFSSDKDSLDKCLFEEYHLDSLVSGERIRERLSGAVKNTIIKFGDGFLSHQDNGILVDALLDPENGVSSQEFYQYLLRLIYRILFLLVIEHRGLVFPDVSSEKLTDRDKVCRKIYQKYYSVHRLRELSERRHLYESQKHDLWEALLSCFRLFEDSQRGSRLGISALGGGLFSIDAIGLLSECKLTNSTLLECLHTLCTHVNPDTGRRGRVNYGGLDAEELGSVYEGLLEYESNIVLEGQRPKLALQPSTARSTSGSHYSPDSLVQPLIKHSLAPLISACETEDDPPTAILGLRIVDIACGSGHILLAAARHLSVALARARTREDQPSPTATRVALREVIGKCIYGVDINPLAVELCRVSLWLEAHVPGKPLGFLHDRIRCGNSIVGQVRREDVLERGLPSEAFVAHYSDDKRTASMWKRANDSELKHERILPGQSSLPFDRHMQATTERREKFLKLTDEDVDEVNYKFCEFKKMQHERDYVALLDLASLPVAQFFLEKTEHQAQYLVSHRPFALHRDGEISLDKERIQASRKICSRERFFHWCVEFPEVLGEAQGGFDCVLGNPPFLGGKRLSGVFGHRFCDYVKWNNKIGLSELMVFFLHRACSLLRPNGYAGLISTNSLIDGRVRTDGLEKMLESGMEIHMAYKSLSWPGEANVRVSLLGLYKGVYTGIRVLNGTPVDHINALLEDSEERGSPHVLHENQNRMKMGTIYLGEGFLLSHTEANSLFVRDSRNQDVIVPILGGQELNQDPKQQPARKIIDFQNWPEERAKEYPDAYDILVKRVKLERQKKNSGGEKWWQFLRRRTPLYNRISKLSHCFVTALTTKYLNFSCAPTDILFTSSIFVLATDRWDVFAILQSSLHESWARKYSGTLVERLTYSCSGSFETFPFPGDIWKTPSGELARLGREFHDFRRRLMLTHEIGLTDLYNLFHFQQVSHQTNLQKFHDLLKLRSLSMELDYVVLDAYGWSDIMLEHGFQESDNLLEDEKNRFTISNSARRQILARLREENHRRAE